MKRKNLISILLTICMLASLGLSGCGLFSSDTESADPTTEEAVSADAESADATVESTFQVNAIEGINQLFYDYYTAYAAGDLPKLQQMASPYSDRELQYISLMSQYISSYSDFIIYSKDGVNPGEYIVSVSMKIHFIGVDNTFAPGIETFYVKTGESGNYYIDNSYSPFNLSAQENPTDETIINFINSYNAQEDTIQLFNEVNTSYQQALNSDTDLQTLMQTTIPNAIAQWNETGEVPNVSGSDTTEETETTEETAEESTDDSESKLDYIPEGTVVTITDPVKVRKSMSETAAVLGSAVTGDKVTVILSYQEGWTKVTWKEQTGYIRTDVLQAQ
jgi:hypothetical protein